MDEKLQRKIVKLADELSADGTVWTRADLASELSDCGVNADSVEVARYVYELYKQTGDEKLRKSFVTNDGASPLVDEYELHSQRLNCQTDELINSVKRDEGQASDSLEKLNRGLRLIKSINAVPSKKDDDSTLLEIISDIDKFSGAAAITKCAETAKGMFEKYSMLKTSYDEAQSEVKVVAKDFVVVRQYVLEIIDRQVRALKDVFGDSIVRVAPELFDFNRIEFLDVRKMYDQVKLEYDRLSETCPVLINEVRTMFKDSFSASIGMAASAVQAKSGSNVMVALALAAMNMYSSHIEAQNKVATCKTQLESLKQNIDYDVATIGSDYLRLLNIFKTINDIYSPVAAAFCRKSEDVLSTDIKEIYRIAYSDPLVSNLVKKRNELLEKRAELELQLSDMTTEVARCESDIKFSKNFISEKGNEYEMAKSRKPKKPSVISKLVSFGNVTDVYAKDLLAWNETDGQVVLQYEKLAAEISMNENDLKSAETSVAKLLNDLAKLNDEIKELDSKITQNIQISDEDKRKIASKLESVVRLLRTGKQIVESKIDDESIKAVSIEKFKSDFLPTNITMNVSKFCEKYGIDTKVSESSVERVAKEESVTLTNEERKLATQATGKAVATTIVLMDNYIELYKKRANGEIQLEYYKEQVEKMKAKFEAQMQSIDKKADALAGIITRINTSRDKDMLRDALIQLGDTSFNLSASDLDDIISGKRKIEI